MDLKKNLKSAQAGKEVREMFKKAGQSTLEYVIILTAIVAGIIVVAAKIQPKVESSLDSISTKMQTQVEGVNFNK